MITMGRQDGAMVSTSHPLAVDSALSVITDGGNAVDAAVAAAAMLCVVDPRSVGVGGDAFAMIWEPDQDSPVALMAAGCSPAGLRFEDLKAKGYQEMPRDGPWTVTVPGAVAGWATALRDHGTMGLDRILRDAIDVATKGFRVTKFVAQEWSAPAAKLTVNKAAGETFLPGGKPPREGDIFSNPDLAGVLKMLADEGASAFYQGELAERIGGTIESLGGPLRPEDLSEWGGPSWEGPVTRNCWSIDVYVPPPPGQGLSILEAIGIYEPLDPIDEVQRDHFAIESLKLALSDATSSIADPLHTPVPTDEQLSDGYLTSRRELIDPKRASAWNDGRRGDTVFVAVVDNDGRCCSWIQSLYESFGSGIVVPGTGIALQNRGANFTLDVNHPNRPAPRKRPYHTIVPTALGQYSKPLGCLGVVGGFMQPQGQFQILREVFQRGSSPQEAVSRPRFRVLGGDQVGLEASFPASVARGLEDLGHRLSQLDRFDAGGAQMILRTDHGMIGASDPRKDGVARGL